MRALCVPNQQRAIVLLMFCLETKKPNVNKKCNKSASFEYFWPRGNMLKLILNIISKRFEKTDTPGGATLMY